MGTIFKTLDYHRQIPNCARLFHFQEPKPKRVCEDVSPKKKADLEQWVEEVKQQWREIQARRAARRHKRSATQNFIPRT